MKQRILYFDIAKSGLMIWIIGIWHLSNYTVYIPDFLEGNVSYLVTIGVLATFTFISGYLAAMSNNDKKLDLKNLLFYYKKRFIRLYPLYFVAVMLFFLFGILEKSQILSAVFMYFPFINNSPVTIWYMGIVFLFYLMVPFINTINNIFLKIFICSILNFLGGGYGTLICGWDERVAFYFFFFWIGMCIFSIKRKIKNEKIEVANLKIAMLSFLFLIVMLCLLQKEVINLNLTVSIFSLFFIIFVIETSKLIAKLNCVAKIFAYISYSSVCAYLFHRIIYTLCVKLFGSLNWGLAVGVVLPITIVIAYYIQKIYDTLIKKMLV